MYVILFLHLLEYITNNIYHQNQSKQFARMARQWWTLKMHKQFGLGHLLSGTKDAQSGQLVLQYPACPWPSVNLPENWENASDDIK